MSTDFIINTYKNPNEKKYIKILTFSPTVSSIIYKALGNNEILIIKSDPKDPKKIQDLVEEMNNPTNNIKVYFYDSGTIDLYDNKQQKLIYQFINPITKNKSSDPTSNNWAMIENTKQKYIYSNPYGAYVLYIDNNNIITLRHNPVPRPEFTKTLTQYNLPNYDNFIANACFDSNLKDPICSCINIPNNSKDSRDAEFCMIDLLGNTETKNAIKNADKRGFDTMAKICDCANSKCPSLNHPYNKARRTKDVLGLGCPDNITMTVCNTSINAGNKVELDKANIAQNCSAGSMTPQNNSGSNGSSTPTSSNDSGSSGSSTPTSSNDSGSNGSSNDSGSNGSSTPTSSNNSGSLIPSTYNSNDNTSLYIIIAVVICLCLSSSISSTLLLIRKK